MERVLQFLKENVVCTLATCSENKPRATVMEYVIVGDSILFATDPASIKAENLKVNNKISLSAHAMPKFVTIDGTTTAPTEDQINEYNKVLFERHPEFKEMVENGMMKPFTYYKLVPETVYYNDYSTGMKPTEVIQL